MKTYTVEQIKKYLQFCDSFGDALYFCDEKHIDEANEPEEVDEDEAWDLAKEKSDEEDWR